MGFNVAADNDDADDCNDNATTAAADDKEDTVMTRLSRGLALAEGPGRA